MTKDLTFRTSSTSAWAFDGIVEEKEPIVVNGGGGPATIPVKPHDLAVVGKEHAERLAEWPDFTREAFARLYRPGDAENRLEPAEMTAWAAKAHRVIETSGSFAELSVASQAHASIAADAAATLARAAASALNLGKLEAKTNAAKDPADLERRKRALEKLADQMAKAGDEAAADEAIEASRGVQREARMAGARRESLASQIDDAKFAEAMGQTVAIAAKIAKEKAEALATLRGFGIGGESIDSGPEDIDPALLKLIVDNKGLRDILRMLGRVKEAASAQGLSRIGDGRCDVVGVRPGGDIEHLIGGELARLAMPALHDETLARIIDKSAMQWEMVGEDHRERGDMVALVDRSGSMTGRRMTFARAVAAAICLRAVEEKRRAYLVLFNDKASTVIIEPTSSQKDLVDALRLLAEPAGGGTNIEGAMAYAAALLAKSGKGDRADVFIATDGVFPVPKSDVMIALKRDGRRVHLGLIGNDFDDERGPFDPDDESTVVNPHAAWADAVHHISDGDLDDPTVGAKILVGTVKR